MHKSLLYILNMLNKGWMISMLVLLPFIQKDFQISLLQIGFLSMTITTVSIVVSFFAGHVNDSFGNRGTILISLCCFVLAWILFYLAPSTHLLYIGYALAGISSGLFDPIANAMIARLAQDHNRATEIGNYAAMGDIGRIALTTITTILVAFFAWKNTVLLYTGLSIVLALIYLLTQRSVNSLQPKVEEVSIIKRRELLRSKKYASGLLAGVLDAFSGSSIYIFIPFLLIPKGIDIKSTGFFTALFFFGYFTGRLILGRFADKHGQTKILIFAEICMALLIVSLVYLESYTLLMLNLFLLGVFTRGTSPVIKSMIAQGLEKRDYEKGYSLYSASVRTSNASSRPIYGFIGGLLGITSIFYVSGAVALLTIIPAIKFYKIQREN